MPTQANHLDTQLYQKSHQYTFSNTLFKKRHDGYNCYIIDLDEGGELDRPDYLMIYFHDLHITIETTQGYESTINGKVEYPNLTIKNMALKQLMSCGNDEKLWYF